jgi:D-alanyl-D-alanine carboxypeptidase/D-alanyl-D-alanine-endopeptidase (penicillin-binding protein 4)
MGVHAINGRIIGDDNAFDDDELGFGWSWDDLPAGYAAGVSALQFDENRVQVTIEAGASVGAPATLGYPVTATRARHSQSAQDCRP